MSLRSLPSVDLLLQSSAAQDLTQSYGRDLTVEALRACLEEARDAIRDGDDGADPDQILACCEAKLNAWMAPGLLSIINATGVILHTNLGRAPLSREAQLAITELASTYVTLEFDLDSGGRGQRGAHIEALITRLTGAEAALVVNNNAAAVLLGLTALAKDRDVLISRSQLVEIGGGFRIPEVMAQSGATVVEVGTTNRTHLKDFEHAVGDDTALIMRAHHSNFLLMGFTAEPSLEALVALGRERGVPVLDDLGSGALIDTATFGLGHEPMVQESVRAGAALVTFSGDKLLGGPQAGLIVGDAASVHSLRKHPMARAVRPDKLCLAALEVTLGHYLRGEAEEKLPVWRMIAASTDSLQQTARAWRQAVATGDVVEGRSTVGGGSLPGETLPTWLLALDVPHPKAFLARLRRQPTPVIARIEDDRVLLDPRTVLPEQGETLLRGLRDALSHSDGKSQS
jgi:L-seryl-tRNA(Ser) seleniumtransferase